MNKFNEEITQLNEKYARKSIKVQTSIRAPRGLDLSDEFISAFQAEFNKLKSQYLESGKTEKKLLSDLGKSLQFLI